MDILCIKARLAFVRYSRSMLHAHHFKNPDDKLHSLDGGNVRSNLGSLVESSKAI